jgi:NAD(P)H dehydrogenase (quinone)
MPTVLVLYHSQKSGNTRMMAEAVARGVQAAGGAARLLNTNDGRVPMDTYREADAVAFGSPDYYSYIAGGLKSFLDDWYIARNADPNGLTGKPYALFYSHGGGGKVRGVMEKLFAGMGRCVAETVGSEGAPDAEAQRLCEQMGEALVRAIG